MDNKRRFASCCLFVAAAIACAGAAHANPEFLYSQPSGEMTEKDRELARKEKELQEKIDRENSPVISGKIAETMDAGGYTYVLLANQDKKTWVAMPEMKVTVGQELTFNCSNEMRNFKSRSIERTFDSIYFCGGPDAKTGGAADGEMAGKTSVGSSGLVAAPAEPVKVQKAEGKNAYTVGEIYASRSKLDNTPIRVRGKVVKFSEGIMKRNWVHLQDGTGDAAKKTHNLVVTTQGTAKVGDVIQISGTLKSDKDFGGGYRYDAIVEEATIN
jgi:hypothetical protein